MSLVLYLKSVENLRGKSDRVVKLLFRGVSLFSKICENADEFAVFDEVFEWPVARPIESEEQLEIHVYNYSKFLSNRLVGTFGMVLQQLVDVRQMTVSDCLLDDNNVPLKTSVNFELTYNPPMSRSNSRSGRQKSYSIGGDNEYDERIPLMADGGGRGGGGGADNDFTMISSSSGRSLPGVKSIRTLGKMMKLGKQRPPANQPLRVASSDDVGRVNDGGQFNIDSLPIVTGEDDSTFDVVGIGKRNKFQAKIDLASEISKSQDFQVSVTVIEARQLAGLNMDPFVCVQVGDQKKYTSVKESTNCPYYNEYFVFDFNLPPAMLFDKIITLSVLHCRTFIRSHRLLGQFKLDVATVYSQPDHQFYHKWAMLTDPDDISSGPKGYVKCDVAVVGKGDTVKAPQKTDKDEDDIEANLLLPAGVPADRQKARFYVRIYKAEGLPKMTTGLMANVKRALTGEIKDLVDPYVVVSFAGHRGKTSVRQGSYEPVWNEQIIFTEMFPPLCRRIKIQLRDNSVNDEIIGTHFLDLSVISNEGDKGFLPTFGPCWINLYGSTRNYSLLEEYSHLNEGLNEGVSYRGRLLVALKTEIVDSQDAGPSMVEVETTLPVADAMVGHPEDMFLFGCIFEANMIDRKMRDKPIAIELSIGNYGNVLDGENNSARSKAAAAADQESDEQTPLVSEDSSDQTEQESHSMTDPLVPRTDDRFYHYLPIGADKPCLWVKGTFEDHRRRLYIINRIEKIAKKLEEDINEVHESMLMEKPNVERQVRSMLDELASSCSRFTSAKVSGSTAGRTFLDQERHKLYQSEVEQVGNMARSMRTFINPSNIKERLKQATSLKVRLQRICVDPQHAMPDIFIWMIQNNRRMAYHRVPAKDVIYSLINEEKGQSCGKIETVFLKLPSKKDSGSAGWCIQAKLQIYLWFGVLKHKKDLLKGLPDGYEDTPVVRRACRILGSPPPSIHYNEFYSFQLRAHMYQARGLIGSDDSGLSDPFARVVFGQQSLCTQVIDETLSPTWDEMIIFNEIVLHGSFNHIKEFPPIIVVEIFDQDRAMLNTSSSANQGKSEFIGRAIARPVVKGSSEKYEKPNFPPQLEWFDVCRGTSDKAGELLAAFELLQLAPPGDQSGEDLPPCELPTLDDRHRGPVMPVPKGIRPTLSKHRIEVLFWGVRELKRIQFIAVDKPRIDIECAGHILNSSVIQSVKKNPNFTVPVKYFDVELPDNEMYCPPITIRCMDCRSFGRFVLVGSHVINNIHNFIYTPAVKPSANKEGMKKFAEKAEFLQQSMLQLPTSDSVPTERKASTTLSTKAEEIIITVEEEKQPLLAVDDPIITINTGRVEPKQEQKPPEPSKKRKKSVTGGPAEEEDNSMESFDWWTKYHASLDCAMQERQERGAVSDSDTDTEKKKSSDDKSRSGSQAAGNSGYGAIPNGFNSGSDSDGKGGGDGKKSDQVDGKKEASEKKLMKGLSKTVAKLSPKAQRRKENSPSNVAQLKLYSNELESQPEFFGFKEWLHTFELFRGKKTSDAEDDESRVVGKFKGALVIYKLPLPTDIEDGPISIGQGMMKICRLPTSTNTPTDQLAVGASDTDLALDDPNGAPPNSIFRGLPPNDPIHVLVRVYVVKALDLHPADINGKADPYIVIRLGQNTINDKEHYISKQLNPVFGKCFEIEATFPQDSLLKVQIVDWDLIGSDDLIGETHIDLENRYYSRQRATCGLSSRYDDEGYNAWRDPMKPTNILSKLCKDSKIDGPYYQPGKVRVGNRIFTAPLEFEDEHGAKAKSSDEHLALAVLHHWEEIPKFGCKLVPEHVETRPLYNPEKPGIEQGKLEMWVDMFPIDMPAPGPPVDISPRKPKSYELRIIIWNTDDVVLEDDAFFTGEKMSDIYVKGWIKGPEDMQSTDIHYRSLTGEGNFNWRFIFPFEYLIAEEKIVITRKDTMFSWDETETKIPARLNLQVWDADHFSSDDFLGALTFDLNEFPRGAKSSKQCTLDMLKTDGSVPQMSLFKHKRVKGWWPFHIKNEGEEMELTGKVEAELHLLTLDEAEKHPAGLGRNEPDPLEKPNRPDTSFIWFLNPLKSIRYILWHNYRWVILKAIVFMLLSLLIALFFYNMPGYMVKKMLGA